MFSPGQSVRRDLLPVRVQFPVEEMVDTEAELARRHRPDGLITYLPLIVVLVVFRQIRLQLVRRSRSRIHCLRVTQSPGSQHVQITRTSNNNFPRVSTCLQSDDCSPLNSSSLY